MLRSRQHGPIVIYILGRSLLGRSWYHAAAYWVDGLLIDSGCAHTARELVQALDDRPVFQVVNTHAHEDHIGANRLLQDERGARILAHPLALPTLADPRGRQPLHPYRRFFWGYPDPSSGEPVPEVIETDCYRFHVIHTPGHCLDHICLYESDKGWLFSGDAYIGGQDRAMRADYDIAAMIASLELLARLDAAYLFPGSGHVRQNPRPALERKIAYLRQLGERIYTLHQRGLTPQQIRCRLLGPELPIAYLTLGHFSGLNLVRAYLHSYREISSAQPALPETTI